MTQAPSALAADPAVADTADSPLARGAIAGITIVVVLLVFVTLYLVPHDPSTGAPSLVATLNAGLNGAAAVCLTLGWVAILRRRIRGHRAFMLSAFAFSTLFLVGYVVHHATVGSVPFQGQGAIRIVYFSLLLPHILLAVPVLPMALLTLYRGLGDRRAAHRKIARVTLPLWLFVSVSGVLVYWMLYHL